MKSETKLIVTEIKAGGTGTAGTGDYTVRGVLTPPDDHEAPRAYGSVELIVPASARPHIWQSFLATIEGDL